MPFSSLAGKFGNYPDALTDDLLYEAQSVYFFTLVVMQWGYVPCVSQKRGVSDNDFFFLRSNLLSTRTRRSSIFQQPPTWGVNRTTIPAAICALCIGIFFCYIPVLCVPLPPSLLHARADSHRIFSHNIFQTSNIPAKHFFIPMTFALALLV